MGQFRPRGAEERLSIGLLRLLVVPFGRVYHRLDVLSPLALPRTGSGILVCNHISALDPVLIQAASRRLIVWMMAMEYARLPLMRHLCRATGIILVKRNGRDAAAVREALRALESGMILGVFPEGRIETSQQMLPFLPGVSMLLQKHPAPVYPAYIDGTQRQTGMVECFVRRQEARVAFGRPVRPDRSLSAEELTRLLETQVQVLSRRVRGRDGQGAAGIETSG